jgi:hypothetical protein
MPENALCRARRYVREAEERIARITSLIELMRGRGQPIEQMEQLLDQYHVWLDAACLHLEFEEQLERRRTGKVAELPKSTRTDCV